MIDDRPEPPEIYRGFMLTLHQLPPLDRAPSLSPFCMKVETYLRMANISYETVRTLDASNAPKGKLPFIEEDGHRLGDSYFIIEHLKRTREPALDARMTTTEHATALAFSRMLDEHLYWAIVHSRWFDERFSSRMIEIFLGALPADQRSAVATMALDALTKTLHAHGLGRHSSDEIVERGKADISAMVGLLADRPFMLGEDPTTLDASTYAYLSNLIDVDMDTALRAHAMSYPTLLAYSQRMRSRYFSS